MPLRPTYSEFPTSPALAGWVLEVAGVMSRALVTASAPPRRWLGVRLQPWAARTVFDVPAEDLRDGTVSLENLWGADATRLLEQVATAPCMEVRQKLLEAALLARLHAARHPAPSAVPVAVRLLEASAGARPIRALAREVGVGERRLERAFHRHVGLSPKALARVFRLQGAVRALGEASHAALAAEGGYADQSHLIREFRALAGLTPERLAAERLSDSSNPSAA